MEALAAVVFASATSTFIQTFAKAAALGSLYAVLALGFVLIFKATQTVNFAHGAIAMAGSIFLSILFIDENIPGRWLPGPSWLHWFLALILAIGVTAILGLILERVAIRPMIGQPLFSVAVITLGLEIVVRTFAFDAVKINTRSLGVPWEATGFRVAGAQIAWSYVAAIAAAAGCFLAVFVFYRSRLGIAMRAVAFDQEAAMAQGIRVGLVFAIAWGAGAALAAVGGVFSSMSPWPAAGVVSTEGSFIAFRALPAVILGGLDSVVGAIAGGMIIGFAEIFAGEYLSGQTAILGAGYQQVVPYLVMLIGLLVRPYGLFGTKEIRRV